MKIVKNISTISFVLAALASCNSNHADDVTEISVPEHGYIFFNTEIDSRGALLEERLEDNFGVFGYTYATDWETAKVLATPNVFHKQLIEYKEVNNAYAHTYSPLQPWLGMQTYSFFAYYPYSMEPSPQTHIGNPYVEYSLASRDDVTKLVDVMTGQVMDTDATARTVDFTMNHRLTAIDIVVRNFSENDVTVEVSAMKITFSNLLYDKVRIPLNANDEPNLQYDEYNAATNTSASYTLIQQGTDQAVAIGPNQQENLTSGNKSIIVIPQDTPLTGTIDITFKNSTGIEKTVRNLEFEMNKETQAGRRYYIQLAFTQEDITIAIVESKEWNDTDNIYHEFE